MTDFHDLRQANLHSFTFKLQAGEMANAEVHKEGLMVVLKYKDKLRKHKSKIIGGVHYTKGNFEGKIL